MSNKIANKIIRKLIREKVNAYSGLSKIKREFSKKYGLPLVSNITLIRSYQQLVREKKIAPHKKIIELLRRRKVRTLSGVSIITVLTKPYPCPGQCLYCPNEPGMPKSYLKKEPAAQRAFLNNFDPFKQIKMRLEALEMTGHPTDKIELIVLGGSWTSHPANYQTWFIKRCFEACNGKISKSLKLAQKINEKARHRIIGLSLETRPDLITGQEAKRMREFGCTRVEIGVQTIYPSVLKRVKRQSDLEDIVRATRILKNYGFKVVYHLMPNLPGSTSAKDFKMFKTIFSDECFQPDMLKIYPCLVLKTAELYKIWKQKKYKPYSQETLTKLLIDIKKIIPPYVRINRLIRDIPSDYIQAGNRATNLRQLIHQKGVKCRCIRCREAREKPVQKDLTLVKRKYKASGGQEYFLSLESKNKKILYAFLRLRLDKSETAMIRELHTYGQSIPLSDKTGPVQHFGLGKKLMKEAEKIAGQKGFKKIAVISGVGVRDYYRKLGYRLKKTYMVK